MTTKALKVLRKVNFSLNESHTILFFDSFVYSESEDNDVRFSKTKVVNTMFCQLRTMILHH